MPRGDHCAVWGCNNDRRYPEKLTIFPHVRILRFYSPKSKKDVFSWARSINRDHFKVSMSTMVCSNPFAQGYKTSECPTPTFEKTSPKDPIYTDQESRSRKKKRSSDETEVPVEYEPFFEDETLLEENTGLDYVASAFPENTDHEASFLVESATQTECLSQVKEKRKYFIDQATCSNNCYCYTGLTGSKLDLVFEFLEPKATEICLLGVSKNTKKSPKKRAADTQKQRKK